MKRWLGLVHDEAVAGVLHDEAVAGVLHDEAVAGVLHDEDGFECLFPFNVLLLFVLGSFLVPSKAFAFSFPIVTTK